MDIADQYKGQLENFVESLNEDIKEVVGLFPKFLKLDKSKPQNSSSGQEEKEMKSLLLPLMEKFFSKEEISNMR